MLKGPIYWLFFFSECFYSAFLIFSPTSSTFCAIFYTNAVVAELVDALRSGRSSLNGSGSSTLPHGTVKWTLIKNTLEVNV